MTVSAQVERTESRHSRRNYPYNCWWVAGLSEEITDEFLSRRILDMQILFYRTAAGEVVALEDRCPHRSLPLSCGKRKGDNVACGYHGFEFQPSGQCVKVPSQPTPGTLSVRSYPVREIPPFVWIYTGDLARLDDTPPPPQQDWMSDPAYNCQTAYITIEGNYMLLKENVLDLTHFGYVHADTFDVPMVGNAPDVVSDENMVGFREKFAAIPLSPFLGEPLGVTPDQLVNMDNWGDFLGPSMVMGALDYEILEPRPGQAAVRNFRIAHATTPIDGRSMHYWWIFGRNFANDQATMEAFAKVVYTGFLQDKTVIEAIQKVYDSDPRPPELLERSVAADRPGVIARRIIDRWLARENTGPDR